LLLRENLHDAASPLHRPATAPLALLHRHPRYNLYFRIMVVDHVNQLVVSRSKEIWCGYVDLCISTNVSISNCPCFLDSPRLRSGVSFHALLWSETEFRRHLQCVLGTIHSPCQDVYPENSEEVLPRICLG
jgi:hypothetical protein